MDGAGGVDLGLEGAGGVGELGSGEDVEVVVCGVAAGVALGTDGGAEDDEVFGDALTGLLARAVRRRKKEKGEEEKEDTYWRGSRTWHPWHRQHC